MGYVEGGGPDGNSGNITKYWAELDPGLQGQPWCAAFVSWCFKHAGFPLPAIDRPYGFIYVPYGTAYFERVGRLHAEPQPGDIAMYSFGHTGIVAKTRDDGWFEAIEGNTSADNRGSQDNGGGVYRRWRHVSQVDGFGRPEYEEDDMFTDRDREVLREVHGAIGRIDATEDRFPAVERTIDDIVKRLERIEARINRRR